MAYAGMSRISDNLKSSLVLSSMQRIQLGYTKVQQQMATGDKLLAPSDDASAASQVMSLDRVMQINAQLSANLKATGNFFSQTDSSMLKIGGSVINAQSSLSGALNALDDQNTLDSKATDVAQYIEDIINQLNQSSGDVYLFGGTASGNPPFVSVANGVMYTGSFSERLANLGGVDNSAIGILGTEAIGMDEVSITGSTDISPAMTADTRLSDLSGALGKGIRLDTIRITDGIVDFNVDLSDCDRVGDVVDKINQAGGGAINCAISADGQSFDITSTLTGGDLKVMEYNSGYTARDLGILNTTGGSAGYTGSSVQPNLTNTTKLSQLAAGSGIDLTSGITITNGTESETFTFDADDTFGDLMNSLNNSDLGISASINDDGTGLNITNLVCGADLHISENGGTTAADLGIRSLDASTKLNSFRDGRGVRITEGKDDLLITVDGTELNVNLDGCESVGDVIDAINDASATAGLTLTASEKTVGNGIQLTDTAGGTISVQSQNSSSAAEDLGLDVDAAVGTLVGEDTFDIRTGGVLDDLIRLQDAIEHGDELEMTFLGGRLEEDHSTVLAVNSRMGGLVRNLEQRQDRNIDMETENMALKSLLADTDYYEAASLYSQLQTALQANMVTSSSMLSTSLLNYLS